MNTCTSQASILNQMKESFETNLSNSQKELITNQKAYENLRAAKTDEIKVDLFQHKDFIGWKAQFGIGSLNRIIRYSSKNKNPAVVPLVFRWDEGSSSSQRETIFDCASWSSLLSQHIFVLLAEFTMTMKQAPREALQC